MVTINTQIPKELRRDVKVYAAKHGMTFKDVLIEALEEKIRNDGKKRIAES